MKKYSCLFFLMVLFSTLMIAQTKFEREYKVKANEVPAKAIQYVKSLGADKKIKWYQEISQAGKSVEGKTKIRNSCYSVEFDMEGNLQDVEVKIGWKEIPKRSELKILEHLIFRFDKFKTQKIQRQYTGDSAVIKQVLVGEKTIIQPTIRYEMVVKGRKNRQVKLYEFLFSEEGEFLEELTIELRNTDNLEY